MLFSFLPRICICITKHFQYHDKFHNKRLNKACNWQQFFHFFSETPSGIATSGVQVFSFKLTYLLSLFVYYNLHRTYTKSAPLLSLSMYVLFFCYFYLIYEEQTVLKEEIGVKLWKRQSINKLLKLCISHESYNNNRST